MKKKVEIFSGSIYGLFFILLQVLVFSLVLGEMPESAEEWNALAQERFSGKDYTGTLEAADKAILLDATLEKAWNIKSAALRNLKRYEDAIDAADEAIALNETYSPPWYNKAESLYNLKKYEEALQSYDKAIELNNRYVYSWIGKSATLIGLKRYEEALEAADEAIALDNSRAAGWNNKAAALRYIGRYEEAVKAADEAIALDELYALPWYNKAEALHNLEQETEALAAYEKSIELNNDFIYSWIGKSTVLNSLGSFEDAAKAADTGINLDNENVLAWINLGIAQESMGDYEKAIQAYETVLQLDPNNTNANTKLKNLKDPGDKNVDPTRPAEYDYASYVGSTFSVEYPRTAKVSKNEGGIRFFREDPPFSMTIALAQKKTPYDSLDEFIDTWIDSFKFIYEVKSVSDVTVGDIPAKQLVIVNKDGEVQMISTFFWEDETPHLLSSGGQADTLTEEEQHFLDTYKNTGEIIPIEENEQSAGKKTYNEETFSFEYPSDWILAKKETGDFSLDVPLRNVYIGLIVNDLNLEFPEFIKNHKQNNLNRFKDYNYIFLDEIPGTSPDGYETVIIEYSHTKNGKLSNERNYFLHDGKKVFKMGLTYRVEESSDIKDLVDELFKTVHLSE